MVPAKSLANLRPVKPGEVRNPQGNSRVVREFRAEILKRSNNGKELLDYLFETLRTSTNDVLQFKCCEMLMQYGLGKPKEAPESDGVDKSSFANLSPEAKAAVRLVHNELMGLRDASAPGKPGTGSADIGK